jgi:hypothetical protein
LAKSHGQYPPNIRQISGKPAQPLGRHPSDHWQRYFNVGPG